MVSRSENGARFEHATEAEGTDFPANARLFETAKGRAGIMRRAVDDDAACHQHFGNFFGKPVMA